MVMITKIHNLAAYGDGAETSLCGRTGLLQPFSHQISVHMSSKLDAFSMLYLIDRCRPSLHLVLCQLLKINFLCCIHFLVLIPVTGTYVTSVSCRDT